MCLSLITNVPLRFMLTDFAIYDHIGRCDHCSKQNQSRPLVVTMIGYVCGLPRDRK